MIQDFWATCTCPEKQSVSWIHCIDYIFLSSGFLSNLHLPWKQSLPWNCLSHGGCRFPRLVRVD